MSMRRASAYLFTLCSRVPITRSLDSVVIPVRTKATETTKMPEQLRFDGKVAVVTGAGAGLGRSYALLLASRGASVVVNDLGGGRHGEGKSSSAADAVVEEIRKAGGKAVANYDSVEFGEKLIQTAIENFGRIDIVVNNAGILRDKSFPRISDADWDLVNSVHLKGSFKVSRAAWPHFKKQNYGRIIMTSSNSGLYGNFGQANYSAAKLGLVGLANTMAIEGAKYNIYTNVITPTAASRLTEDILPPDLFQELRPELIAPVVAYLCHESCTDNGAIIQAAAGWAGKCHLVRSNGSVLRDTISDNVTIEDVAQRWGDVTDMSDAVRMESIGAETGALLGVLEKVRDGVKGTISSTSSYKPKDLILYALGIGCSTKTPDDLKFLYEGEEEFSAFPTFAVIPSLNTWMEKGMGLLQIPGKTIDLSKVLHGEQYIELFKPLPTSGKIETRCRVVEVLDKGKGAVGIINVEIYDESGEKVAFTQISTYLIGCGGFGGPKVSKMGIPLAVKPNRAADASVTQSTLIDQAAIYRLSGDINPLHISPDMASLMGFGKPILHGLCSLGFAARHVLLKFANNDATLFKAIKVRFSRPVTPGETLRTDMWREGNRIHFETLVVETGSVVISGAYVDLHKVIINPTLNRVSASDLLSDAVFKGVETSMKEDEKAAKGINAVFVYNISKNGKQAKKWTLDFKNLSVYEGDPKTGKADTTFSVSDEDFVDLAQGKLNPQVAFMKGKLKIAGNIMMAEKMRAVLKSKM